MGRKISLSAIAIMISATFFLCACGGGGGGSDPQNVTDRGESVQEESVSTEPPSDQPVPDQPTPPQEDPPSEPSEKFDVSIALSEAGHAVTFDLSSGAVKGFISDVPIYPQDVKAVAFNSARVDWGLDSTAFGQIDADGVATIEGTANNDKGNWCLVLMDNSVIWFDIEGNYSISGLPWEIVGDQIVYGGFREAKIELVAPGKARVHFGSNLLSGLMETGIDPSGVLSARWNSNKVGWGESSTAISTLQVDENKDLFFTVDIPSADLGNFSLVLSDGTVVWFDVEAWICGSGVTVRHDIGQIEFVSEIVVE